MLNCIFFKGGLWGIIMKYRPPRLLANLIFSSYFDGNMRSLEDHDRREYTSVSEQFPSLLIGCQFREDAFCTE